MSYIRPLENNACLYIYPNIEGGVHFMAFPEHFNETIPDEMLDILLYKMSNEELERRRKHGSILLKALNEEDFDAYKTNKNFWKENRQW